MIRQIDPPRRCDDLSSGAHERRRRRPSLQQSTQFCGRFIFMLLMLSFAASCSSAPLCSLSRWDKSLQECGRLGPLPYPFGKEGSNCGASPQFSLSGCGDINDTRFDKPQVFWDSFYGCPAIVGLDQAGIINVSWVDRADRSTTMPSSPSCQVYSRQDLYPMLPKAAASGSGIDFRTDPDFSAFYLTPNNVFLLFNCTNSAHMNSSNYIQVDSKNCMSFQSQCESSHSLLKGFSGSCAQFYAHKKLDLGNAMSLSGCSHFQFLLTENASLPLNEWVPHVLQLTWTPKNYNFELGPSCRRCEASNGTCGFADRADFRCFCPYNRTSAIDCNTLNVNHHSNCTIITISSAVASLSTLIIVSLILKFHRLRRSRRRIFDSNSAPNSNLEVGNHQQLWSFPSDLGPISLQKYSYHEILEATQSFADVNIIGYGGSGFVYRGVLKDGRVVAIKRHAHQHFERMDQFYNEIRILSMVDHPNLVKLYGFCHRDDKDLLLVFEHVCNGSLYDQLHHQKDAEKKDFSCGVVGINSWRVRLRLSMEIAQALSFLHNCASPQILHRDVKTSNILLDDGFHAKLADFGLSRLVPLRARHVSTDPQGTPGYIDPEYLNCYRLTDKSDVYSFGVVLMELVSGMLPVDVSRSEKDTILSSMALLKEKEGTWKELVDSNCWREDKDINAGIVSLEMMQLAFWCLRPNKEDRPSMGEVAGTLIKLWWSYGAES